MSADSDPPDGTEYVLHIAESADWRATDNGDSYRVASLDTEGFVHCSTPKQVLATAQRYYAGRSDLVLLVVDPGRVRAELRYEVATDGELFPHFYGPIERRAVVAWAPFHPDHTELPPGLV